MRVVICLSCLRAVECPQVYFLKCKTVHVIINYSKDPCGWILLSDINLEFYLKNCM